MGLEIDGAMQQAPQPGRQDIACGAGGESGRGPRPAVWLDDMRALSAHVTRGARPNKIQDSPFAVRCRAR
jgi:hypothetical protein